MLRRTIPLGFIIILAVSLLTNLILQSHEDNKKLKQKAFLNAQIYTDENIYDFLTAAETGDYNLVESFLALGFDPNATNNDGSTALMGATLNGHNRVIKLLLKYNANPLIINHVGYSAQDYAVIQERGKIVNLFASYTTGDQNRNLSSTSEP